MLVNPASRAEPQSSGQQALLPGIPSSTLPTPTSHLAAYPYLFVRYIQHYHHYGYICIYVPLNQTSIVKVIIYTRVKAIFSSLFLMMLNFLIFYKLLNNGVFEILFLSIMNGYHIILLQGTNQLKSYL